MADLFRALNQKGKKLKGWFFGCSSGEPDQNKFQAEPFEEARNP